MNKTLVGLLISAVIFSATSPSYAWTHKKPEPNQIYAKTLWNEQQGEVVNLVNKIVKLSNERKVNDLKELYSTTFISGDGMDLSAFFEMIDETWKAFPDMKYSTNILNVTVNGDYATVESLDSASSNNLKTSELTDDKGILSSNSQGLLYLRKYGKDWKVVSDKVFSEETVIKYGTSKTLNVNLVTPSQVKAGEDYTASLYADIPPGMVAVGSIIREPIAHPSVQSKEVFRQLPPETQVLERLLKANTSNINELTTASVGFSESTEDQFALPDVKLTGLTVISKRVNVIPISTFDSKKEPQPKQDNAEPEENANTENQDN
ncbi:MAG: hypothetical protein WCK67_10030 [bacterium]